MLERLAQVVPGGRPEPLPPGLGPFLFRLSPSEDPDDASLDSVYIGFDPQHARCSERDESSSAEAASTRETSDWDATWDTLAITAAQDLPATDPMFGHADGLDDGFDAHHRDVEYDPDAERHDSDYYSHAGHHYDAGHHSDAGHHPDVVYYSDADDHSGEDSEQGDLEHSVEPGIGIRGDDSASIGHVYFMGESIDRPPRRIVPWHAAYVYPALKEPVFRIPKVFKSRVAALRARAAELSPRRTQPLKVTDLPLDILRLIFDRFQEPARGHPDHAVLWSEYNTAATCERRKTIASLRLTCRIFSQLASPLMFPVLRLQVTQFSLDLANNISRSPLLASGVRGILLSLAVWPKQLADDKTRFARFSVDRLMKLAWDNIFRHRGKARTDEEMQEGWLQASQYLKLGPIAK